MDKDLVLEAIDKLACMAKHCPKLRSMIERVIRDGVLRVYWVLRLTSFFNIYSDMELMLIASAMNMVAEMVMDRVFEYEDYWGE